MIEIVYLKSDNNNIARPFMRETYPDVETATDVVNANERDDELNLFVMYDNGELVRESDMVGEYRINIYDYL